MKDSKITQILSSIDGIPTLTEREYDLFDNLSEILVEENKKVNVTSITDPVGIALKHFADSLSLLEVDELKREKITLADIGCGGGFPGLPVKIARPDIDLTMIDSTEKKIRYVAATADKLGMSGVCPIAARAEDIAGRSGELRECFDVVTSRAVARLNVLVELCMPFVKVGGVFVAMKAASAEDELSESLVGIKKLGGKLKYVKEIKFDLSRLDTSGFTDSEKIAIDDFLGAKRYMIVIEKLSHTPDAYPRMYARITKKPL